MLLTELFHIYFARISTHTICSLTGVVSKVCITLHKYLNCALRGLNTVNRTFIGFLPSNVWQGYTIRLTL